MVCIKRTLSNIRIWSRN